MASFAKVANPERVAVSIDRLALRQLLAVAPVEDLVAALGRHPLTDVLAAVDPAELVDVLKASGYVCLPPNGGRVNLPAGLEIGRRTIRWRGQTHRLTPREIALVGLLAAAHPQPLTYDEIGGQLWADKPHPVENARVYVYYVRRKVPGLLSSVGHGNKYRSSYVELNPGAPALAEAS